MNISKEQILRQISYLTSQTCERHHISPELQTSQICTHTHRQTHMHYCLRRVMPLSLSWLCWNTPAHSGSDVCVADTYDPLISGLAC